jgi:hypothetical protein
MTEYEEYIFILFLKYFHANKVSRKALFAIPAGILLTLSAIAPKLDSISHNGNSSVVTSAW